MRFVVFSSLFLLLAACSRQAPPVPAPEWSVDEQLLYYGIPVRVLFSPANEQLEKEVWRYLHKIDDRYNDWRDDSEIGRLNVATVGQPLPLDREFADVWKLCLQAHAATDGAFDPTIRPLRQLWRDAEKSAAPPSPTAVAEAVARGGIDKLTIDDKGVATRHDAGVSLDLGGVIKGFAVDHVANQLRTANCSAALVQIGGETVVWGTSKRGKPHAIAIQHPTNLDEYWTVLEDPGSGFSCATSGNYRNPVKIGDQTYYHVIDPRTGQPVDTDVLSVTILFPQPGRNGLADALSTAGAVLGPEATLRIAAEFGAEALVLIRDGEEIKEIASPGFAKFKRPL